MRRRIVYWSLFHHDEKNQIDDLKTDQVEAIWAAIPKSQRSQWLIWRESFRTWKPFTEFSLLIEDLRKERPRSEPPPMPPKVIEDQEREIEALLESEFNLTTTARNLALAENRKQGRYDGKFKLRVRSADKVYDGQTANISMEGMLLQKPLPDWVPKYFTVISISTRRSSSCFALR